MSTRILISGVVQGVWFRESTRQEALRLGVSGWARNLPDGRVEALIDGPEDAVNALLEWCHHGPEAAQVDQVHAELSGEAVGSGFVVQR